MAGVCFIASGIDKLGLSGHSSQYFDSKTRNISFINKINKYQTFIAHNYIVLQHIKTYKL